MKPATAGGGRGWEASVGLACDRGSSPGLIALRESPLNGAENWPQLLSAARTLSKYLLGHANTCTHHAPAPGLVAAFSLATAHQPPTRPPVSPPLHPPSIPRHLCVTFAAHLSKTYKRTSPKFSVPIRAYTRHVSPCAFSRKTAKNPHHPNTCPPQDLQTKKIACVTLCHLRFCSTCARSTPLFSPSAPRPLNPSSPFFAYCHPGFVDARNGVSAQRRLA